MRLESLSFRESIDPPSGGTDNPNPDPRQEPLDGIRCPLCGWQPRASDRWQCSCKVSWNTFTTRGRCPGCSLQWTETQCLACQGWALHVDWYESRALQ